MPVFIPGQNQPDLLGTVMQFKQLQQGQQRLGLLQQDAEQQTQELVRKQKTEKLKFLMDNVNVFKDRESAVSTFNELSQELGLPDLAVPEDPKEMIREANDIRKYMQSNPSADPRPLLTKFSSKYASLEGRQDQIDLLGKEIATIKSQTADQYLSLLLGSGGVRPGQQGALLESLGRSGGTPEIRTAAFKRLEDTGKLKELQSKSTPEKTFAPQVSNKYIPVGDDKFQLTSVDEVSGTTKPILKDGKPIILTEKQVLIAEGKKAESLIDPFETKFFGKLGESEAVRLTEMKKTAVDAVNSIEIIDEGLVLLNSGIYTGSAANIRLNFNKWLQEAGVKVGNSKAANTEAYAGLMGLQVGKIIKAFGAGTGLSDADREYAEKIAGGKITLTEDSLRKLLDVNRRLADFAISEYNRQSAQAKQSMEDKDFFKPIESTSKPVTAQEEADAYLKGLPK